MSAFAGARASGTLGASIGAGVGASATTGLSMGGRGAGSGSTIAPCAFQLDVQWILDMVDRIKEIITKVEQVATNVLQWAHKVLDTISGFWGSVLFGGIPFAKDFVIAMCKLVEKAVSFIAKIYNGVLEVSKHVLAPWEVRSAGEQIRDDLAPKCAEFSQMLHPGNLKSASSWTGASSEAFRNSLTTQFDTSKDVADAAKEFGSTVQEIGADGVKTTISFCTKLVTAIGGIITAATAMAAIPVGTAVGAATVMGLVSAVIAYIMVYVNAMMEIIQQSSALGNAASTVPGGQWPTATV